MLGEYQTLTNRATQFSPTLGQVQQSTDKPSCVSRSIPPWTRTSQNFTTSIAPWARPKQESAHFDAPTALSQREQPVASQSALETASEVNASVAVNNISSAASPAEVDVSETANLELAQQLLRLGITADQVNQLNALLSTYANVENESLCYGATVPSDHQENASQTFFSSQSMSNSDVSRALHNTSEPMTPLPLTGSGRPFSHSDAQTPISSLPTPFQNLYHSSMSRLAQPSCHRSINIHEPNQTVQAAYITSRHVSDFVTNATPFFAPDTTTTTATTLQAHHQPLLSSLECGQSRSVFDVRSVASESQHPRTQNLTTQRSLDGTLYSGLERRCPNTSSYDLKTAIRNDADLRALPVGASLQPSVSSTAYQDAPYISNRKNSTSTYATPPDQRATLLSTAAATASHVSSVFFYPNTAVETAANSLAHCPRAPQPAALQAPWSLFEQHSARSSHILSPFLSLIPSDSCQQKSLSNALVQNATMLSSTRPVVKDPFATLMSPPSLPQVPRTSELDHTNFPRSDKPTMFLDPVKPCDPDRFSPNYTSLSLAEPVPTAKCEEEINVRPRSSPSSAPASSEQPVTANPRVPANGSVTALARPEKALPAPPPQVDNFFRQAASHAFTVQKFLKHPLSFDPIGLQRLISIFDIRKRDLRSGIVSRGRFAPEVSFQNSSEASFKLRGLGDIKPDVPTYPSLPSCIVVKRIQLTAAAYDHLSAEAQGYLIADTTGSAFLCLHNVFPNPNLSNNLPLKHQRRSWIFQSTIHPDGQLHPSDIIALENVTTQWITGNLVRERKEMGFFPRVRAVLCFSFFLRFHTFPQSFFVSSNVDRVVFPFPCFFPSGFGC